MTSGVPLAFYIMELKKFIKWIFTLKSGKQIEICSDQPIGDGDINMEGVIATPLIMKKSVSIVRKQIAAIERIEDPHIQYTVTND